MDNYYGADKAALAATTLHECQDVQARSRKSKLFSHITALKLLGIELPRGLSCPDSQVCTPWLSRRSRMRGVKFYRWHCVFDPIDIDATVSCVHPVDAWLQCASWLDEQELTVLAENILRWDPSLDLSLFNVNRLPEDIPRFHGLRRCEKTYPQIRLGTDSSQETRMRLSLIAAGLPEPVVDYSPPGLMWNDELTMRFDLAYPDLNLLLEYDGEHHWALKRQWANDHTKRNRAMAAGWVVLEITAADLTEAPTYVQQIIERSQALKKTETTQEMTHRHDSPGKQNLFLSAQQRLAKAAARLRLGKRLITPGRHVPSREERAARPQP